MLKSGITLFALWVSKINAFYFHINFWQFLGGQKSILSNFVCRPFPSVLSDMSLIRNNESSLNHHIIVSKEGIRCSINNECYIVDSFISEMWLVGGILFITPFGCLEILHP